MSSSLSDDVRRDEFISSFGSFLAEPGRVERVEVERLRSLFLPKLTPDGQEVLSGESNFVRSQLNHYGVQLKEREFVENGTALMKFALKSGKCDQVPEYIVELQKQMQEEWLINHTPEELSANSEWVMQRYFLSDGQPNRLKTTRVICIPIDRYSEYRFGRMTEAADEIPGLHYTRVFGFIFMGWNRAAVRKAVSRHFSKDRLEPWESESEGQIRREKLHRKYLVKLNRRTENVSPIGRYIVESEHIDAEPICVGIDLVLDIRRTEIPGVCKVDFDLGVAVGVMFMCSEKAALD